MDVLIYDSLFSSEDFTNMSENLTFCVSSNTDSLLSRYTPPYEDNEEHLKALFEAERYLLDPPPIKVPFITSNIAEDGLPNNSSEVASNKSESPTYEKADSPENVGSVFIPSDDESYQYKPGKAKKCFASNKNALIARKNREKKKKYIQTLEYSFDQLSSDRDTLLTQVSTMKATITKLNDQVSYLKSVLENQSDLAKVLSAVSDVPGLKLHPFLNSNGSKQSSSSGEESDDQSKPKKCKLAAAYARPSAIPNAIATASGKGFGNTGICLHVKNGKISVELCAECNKSAR